MIRKNYKKCECKDEIRIVFQKYKYIGQIECEVCGTKWFRDYLKKRKIDDTPRY